MLSKKAGTWGIQNAKEGEKSKEKYLWFGWKLLYKPSVFACFYF